MVFIEYHDQYGCRSTTMILLLHRKNEVTEIQTKYNDKLFPNGMGLCFHIPEQGKTPLQTLTYNRNFNPGTETFTSQTNSRYEKFYPTAKHIAIDSMQVFKLAFWRSGKEVKTVNE